MEASGLIAAPGKELRVFTEQKVGWAPKPVWRICRKKLPKHVPAIEPHGSSVAHPIA